MKKEKWESMTDDQKTTFMRNVFKNMSLGENFDYAECKRFAERFKEERGHYYGVFNNPCIVLNLVDPILACTLMSWMYAKYNDNGERDPSGETAPLFGYNMTELYFDKGSLMEFSDTEKQVLRRAVEIISEKVKEKQK